MEDDICNLDECDEYLRSRNISLDLARKKFYSGQYREAYDLYQEALNADRENSYILYKLGTTTFHLGDYEESSRFYRESLEHNPEENITRYLLARSYYFSKRYNESLNELEQVLVFQPENPAACLYKVKCLAKLERWEELLQADLDDNSEVKLLQVEALIRTEHCKEGLNLYKNISEPGKRKYRNQKQNQLVTLLIQQCSVD